jgi:hypothetical protein
LERHFSSTAALLLEAAAAPRGSGAGAGASSALAAPAAALVPTPAEWRSLYKLLTFVPWASVFPHMQNEFDTLHGCAPHRLQRDAMQRATSRLRVVLSLTRWSACADAWLAPASASAGAKTLKNLWLCAADGFHDDRTTTLWCGTHALRCRSLCSQAAASSAQLRAPCAPVFC